MILLRLPGHSIECDDSLSEQEMDAVDEKLDWLQQEVEDFIRAKVEEAQAGGPTLKIVADF